MKKPIFTITLLLLCLYAGFTCADSTVSQRAENKKFLATTKVEASTES